MGTTIKGGTLNREVVSPTIYSVNAYADRSSSITFDVIGEPTAFFVVQTDRDGRALAGYKVVSAFFDGTTKELVYTNSPGLSNATSYSTTSVTYSYNANTKKFTVTCTYVNGAYFEYRYKLLYTCLEA